MATLQSIIGFLLILGPLVVFHEFGHYIFARIFNVKAEIFSIGFGPRIWRKQLGETELRIAAIPMGGFVKLLGEDREAPLSPKDQKRALQNQAAWKRFFIFFGGPLFNFILAVIVFMLILLIGEPQMASVVGRVVRGSPAELAGFKSGDRILGVSGQPVSRFDEVINLIGDRPDKPIEFTVSRPSTGRTLSLKAKPSAQSGFSVYGEPVRVGEIDGLLPMGRSMTIGISDPASPAGKAGLQTGEKIVQINGAPIQSWEDFEDLFRKTAVGTSMKFLVESAKGKKKEAAFVKPAAVSSSGEAWGLYSSELFIERTLPKSPAAGAGLRPGDRLVAVGDTVFQSFYGLKDAVQDSGEKQGKVPLKWERDGKMMAATVVPTTTTTRDAALNKSRQFTVGVVPMLVWNEPATIVERIYNPFKLVSMGVQRMVTFTWRNFVSIQKMITGEVSVATLGGPILIGKIAGESLTHGLIAFLSTMAILSIGLGVLNILPVPVLDGGHLLLLAIESIRGKPLTMRQMEIIQGVGLSLIALLMIVVIRNDLARLPLFD